MNYTCLECYEKKDIEKMHNKILCKICVVKMDIKYHKNSKNIKLN